MKTVAEVLVSNLKAWGVQHVFGVPGKAIVPLILEFGNQGVEYILSRHETGAGFSASGYAFMRKNLGVAVGTSGPGGTNLITAAGQAKAYHVPVLFITGHASMKETGKPLGQDSTFYATDLVEMFRSVTLFSARLERGDLLQAYLSHAIERAFTGTRGPVHLSIPLDILVQSIEPFSIPLPSREPQVVSNRLHDVLPLLSRAQRPVLILGKGVHLSESYDEVKQFAEAWHLPVLTTPGGKGAFATGHPLSVGAFGLGGAPEADAYLKSGVDLMVVVGTKLSDMSVPALSREHYPKHIIHFDIDPTFVGKALPVPTLFVQGDARLNLQRLLASGGVPDVSVYSTEAAAAIEAPEAEAATVLPIEAVQITAKEVMDVLGAALPEQAMVFGDDGSHSYHAIRHLEIKRPGSFMFDDVFACMGHAIGYAVGAQIGVPEQQIVCLTGDGCLFMHGAEISTAVNQGARVIFIVLNNGQLDMVNKGMKNHVGRTDGTVYHIPMDALKFGEAMGAAAYSCRTRSEFKAILSKALTQGEERATVIEVLVDRDEIPPTMARG